MAFLRSTRAAERRAAPILFGMMVVTLVGCVIFRDGGARAFAFSHRVHVEEEGLECINCHEDAMASDDPGMPAPELCVFCHDALDEDKPPERRVENLFEEQRFRAAHASRLSDEVIFSHLRHTAAGLECSACHTGIERDERIDAGVAVDMPACMTCHASREQPNECATCHSVIDRDWAPDNHQHNWEKAHGGLARAGSDQPASTCSLCHVESSCIQCHIEFPPDDHTNIFRVRTHGILATMDRSRCLACHRSSSCEACHAEVRPLGHVGDWGSPRSRHCLGCHFPLRSNGCVVCHRATPSHALGAPKPGWHTPAMNCRQCHGVNAALPHFDNGSDCNACHP